MTQKEIRQNQTRVHDVCYLIAHEGSTSMRKTAQIILGLLLISLLGCSLGDTPTEMLFIRTPTGIATLDPTAERITFQARNAVASHDWSRVYRTEIKQGFTHVSATEPSLGEVASKWDVAGELDVKVVSADGTRAALGLPKPNGNAYPAGRESTLIVIATEGQAEPRRLELPGNFEPEAFSRDGSGLFVIEYLPALAPDRYRVRLLNLNSAAVTAVSSPDSQLQESMKGTARTQAMSPDGNQLYTLYSLDGQPTQGTFIHVLSLDQNWAHCIDLPPPLGVHTGTDVALTTSPDGHIFVVDVGNGMIAEVDPSKQKVIRSERFVANPSGDKPKVSVSEIGRVFVGSGSRVISFDPKTLKAERSWRIGGNVSGVQASSSEGSHVYVSTGRRIEVLDAETGKTVRHFEVTGVETITELGRLDPTLGAARTEITCAC